jgi:hypothetical protein
MSVFNIPPGVHVMRLFNTQLFHPGEPEIDTARADPIERPRYGNHLWTRHAQKFARKYGHRQVAQPVSIECCAGVCCA